MSSPGTQPGSALDQGGYGGGGYVGNINPYAGGGYGGGGYGGGSNAATGPSNASGGYSNATGGYSSATGGAGGTSSAQQYAPVTSQQRFQFFYLVPANQQPGPGGAMQPMQWPAPEVKTESTYEKAPAPNPTTAPAEAASSGTKQALFVPVSYYPAQSISYYPASSYNWYGR